MTQPCAAPDANPDDWFINREGRQYFDDSFLSSSERRLIRASVLRRRDDSDEDYERRMRRAERMAETDRRRKALQSRRHAKEACLACPSQKSCLKAALDLGAIHGTWGGLYEEEIAEMRNGDKDND